MALLFPCEFCEISKNTLFIGHLQMTTSIFYKMTGSQQPEDLLRMHSTTDFSWYCTASYLSKKGFHHQPLHSKPYKLTVNGISKILWTVTITNISFSVVQNSDNEFNSSSMLVIHSNNLLKIYNIIRAITLINPVS